MSMERDVDVSFFYGVYFDAAKGEIAGTRVISLEVKGPNNKLSPLFDKIRNVLQENLAFTEAEAIKKRQ